MNKGIKEQLENLWCEDKDDVKPLDKDSISYFMTKMSQQEFSEKTKNHEKQDYEFNRIQEPILKSTESRLEAVKDVDSTSDREK